MIAALLLIAGAGAPAAGPAQIEQLAPPPSPRRSAEAPAPPLPQRADSSSPRITQLPNGLNPVTDGEGSLAAAPKPSEASRSAIEIARAIDIIRGRGQQPTPELIAREVGPEVLENYLTRGTAIPPPAQPSSPAGKPTDAAGGGSGLDAVPQGITILSPKG